MQFIRTGKRTPKGLRTPEEIDLPDIDGAQNQQGTFQFVDPSTVVFTFLDGTSVAVVIQKAATYSIKAPLQDALSTHVPLPVDNNDDEDTPVAPVAPVAPGLK